MSDKTILKWERGVGLPEISLLIPLCEMLDLSVERLLGGKEEDTKTNPNPITDTIKATLGYAKIKTKEGRTRILRFIAYVLMFCVALAIVISFVVEYAIYQELRRSLIVSVSVLYGIAILLGLTLSKRNYIRNAFIITCIGWIPLLYVIGLCYYDMCWFYEGAIPIGLLGTTFAIICYGIWFKLMWNNYFNLALIIALSAFLDLAIGLVVQSTRSSFDRSFAVTQFILSFILAQFWQDLGYDIKIERI